MAKRMAREMGVELGQLKGSGPGGRIVKADVEAAAKGGATTAEAEAPPQEEAPAEGPPEAAPAEEETPKKDVPAPVVSGDKQTGRGEATQQDLTRLQQTVARRMAESKATAPTSCSPSRSTWRRPSRCASSSRPPPATRPRRRSTTS